MSTTTVLKRVAMVAALALCAGCGIGVQVTGSPQNAAPGQPVTFHVTLTNHGQCPVKTEAEVLPFATPELIATLPLQEQLIVTGLCTGHLSLNGLNCVLVGDQVFCNGLPLTSSPMTFGGSFLPSPITCGFSGNLMQCQVPAADLQSAPSLSSDTFIRQQSTDGIGCVPSGPGFICDVPEPLSPGASVTFDLTLTAPPSHGTLSTLVGELQTDGVCQGGPTPGQPCGSDVNCGTGGFCRTSICQEGTNDGVGCVDSTTCGGGTCVACVEPTGPTTTTFFTPLGCATTNATTRGAPALSGGALLGLILLLLVLGFATVPRLYRNSR